MEVQLKFIYFETQSTFKMSNNEKHIEDLQQIRSMMEKSTQFISLSGFSGISAGIFGLIGAALAYLRLIGKISFFENGSDGTWLTLEAYQNETSFINIIKMTTGQGVVMDLVLIATLTLGLALIFATYFTYKKAKKDAGSLWTSTSKRLLLNTAYPLVIGGTFSLALLTHGLFGLLAPTTLIFYGLALINGSKYTLPEIKYVGIFNIFLGLINTIFIGQGLFFWALGFGVVHIVYGVVMYFKYDRK